MSEESYISLDALRSIIIIVEALRATCESGTLHSIVAVVNPIGQNIVRVSLVECLVVLPSEELI